MLMLLEEVFQDGIQADVFMNQVQHESSIYLFIYTLAA